MTNKKRTRLTFLFICLLFIFPHLQAQLKLGNVTLVNMEAQTLQSPAEYSRGKIYTQKSLASVGGIAFELEALPDSNFSIDSLILSYEITEEDGKRLVLVLNDSRVKTLIYDWQLIPIARYADSPYKACITYFGGLKNKKEEESVKDKGGQIINYHPAFENTLLGLRLMQCDLMLMYTQCADLPKKDNTYILGMGETRPDISQNQYEHNNLLSKLNNIENKLRLKFRSYLISDYNQNIRFFVKNDSLHITGFPFYYCWRYKYESLSEKEQLAIQNKIKTEVETQLKKTAPGKQRADAQREWAIKNLLHELRIYEHNYQIYSEGTVVEAIQKKDSTERISYLEKYATNSLIQLVIKLRYYMNIQQPEYLKEYSELLSEDTNLLRASNPAVWDAVSNTMRFAAFFRYCKENFSDEWGRFSKQIRQADIIPVVETPTVLWP